MFAPISPASPSPAPPNLVRLDLALQPVRRKLGTQKTAYGALLVGGKDVPLTTSVTIEGGQLKLLCPQQATAALVPTESDWDEPRYTVQLVSKPDDLQKGSIFTGWTTQDGGVSLPDDLLTVVNTRSDWMGLTTL